MSIPISTSIAGFIIALFMGTAGFLVYRHQQVIHTWPSFEGKIIKSEPRFGEETTHTDVGRVWRWKPYVQFEYTIDGHTFINDHISNEVYSESASSSVYAESKPSKKLLAIVGKYPIGSKVMGYYNPANPSQSYLEIAKGGYPLFFGISLIALVFSAASIAYYYYKRNIP